MDQNTQRNIDETNIYIRDTLLSVGAKFAETLKDAVEDAFTSADASVLNTIGKDLTKSFNRLVKLSDDFALNQSRINAGTLKSKDIEKQLQTITEKRGELTRKILHARRLGVEVNLEDLRATNESLKIQEEQLRNDLARTEEIKKRLGLTGQFASALSDIPGLNKFIDAKELEQELLSVSAAGGNTLEQLGTIAQHVGDRFKAFLGVGLILYLAKAGLEANKQTVDLAKSLSQSEYQAAQTRDNFAAMARESGDAFLTTEKLVQSTLKLGQQLGIASTFSADLTKEFTTLTQRIGLSEEAAGGLAKASIITGRSLKSIKNDAAGAVSSISAQYGVQLNIKDVLEKAGKASSLLLANFKGNPVELAKAVAEMEELGTSLETTQKQANALLDFQTSIANQLEASLITGRNINLDKARELALNNDLVGVAKELVGQQMDYNTFGEMNAIQRRSFAKSIGLETQELSDQLLKLEYMGKSRKEVAALAGEEAAKRLETLNAQEKFNNAVEKLKDIFVALVDGPIGQLLGLLTDVLSVIGKIGTGIAKAIPAPLLKILAGVGTGAAIGSAFGGIGAPIGAIAGGVLATAGVIGNSDTADDLMSGYGDRTLVTPNGSYALNNNDTVIAGTNLFRGNDVYSGPAGAINMSQPEFDYGKLAQAMSQIKVVSVSKPSEFAPFISREQNKAIGVKI
jgi:hypothetical protein